MNSQPCQVCGDTRGRDVAAREMMFGLKDRFVYWECSGCGGVQLHDPPENMAAYYPDNYYSFEVLRPPEPLPANPIRRWLFRKRNAAQVLGTGGLWGLVASLRPWDDFDKLAAAFSHTGIRSADDRILEVGCGSGRLLRSMASAGFGPLVGVDPFVRADESFGDRLKILSRTLDQVEDIDFDLIIFNHSLEHMPDQIGTLRETAKRLRRSGTCVLRIPIAGSDPWNRYGSNWVELDPPRHYFLHTKRSLEIVARSAGLEISHIEYEESSFGYWGSELYSRDIALSENGVIRDPRSYFSATEIQEFEGRAAKANAEACGGRAAFFLRMAR